MKIHSLWVDGYKNIIDTNINFSDERSIAIIGNNGTGKSNLIEALLNLFVDLYYGKFSDFKYLEGTFIGILVGALAALPFVSVIEAFVGSAVAMTLESIELSFEMNSGKVLIDDNLFIPIIAGITIFILRNI